jgi:AraC-like DNA-binding protein
MDALSGLLDGPRARDSFLLRAMMRPPWGIRIRDEAPLSLVALVAGDAWVVLDDGSAPTRLGTGDLAILRGPDHYTMADDPATPVQVVCHPGQVCTTPDGVPVTEAMTLGVRTWGNDPDGPVTMLVGTYRVEGAVSRRLVDALPPLAVVRHDDWSSPLPDLLGDEIVKDEPGQDLVLDRLLDLLLVAVLRAWFSRPEAEAPAWYRAHADPVVGPALRHLHNDPARPWTVSSLAAATGVSRAALARRFTELVGEPPMTFLTGWRLALAADLLREPGATVGGVARQVGYATPFALSTAFKRAWGVSPREHRALAGAL